jgi:hypothetical protein
MVMKTPGRFTLTFGSLQAGTAVLLGIVNLFRPGAFRSLAFGYIEATADYYFALLLIVGLVVLTLFLR